MSVPARCPACGAETAADPSRPPTPCPACGYIPDAPPPDDDLPVADEILAAVPVGPPPRRRRRSPAPPLLTEADAAWGVRWAIILAGLLVVGSCLLVGLLAGPLRQPPPPARGL